MRRPKGVPCHECAPKGWRGRTPNQTGDFDLDEAILHRSNKDMPDRLKMYIRKAGPVTGYDGYHNYHGDD